MSKSIKPRQKTGKPTMAHERRIRRRWIQQEFLAKGILKPEEIKAGLELSPCNMFVEVSTVKSDLRAIGKKWEKEDQESRQLVLGMQKRLLFAVEKKIRDALENEDNGILPTYNNLVQFHRLIADINGHTKQNVDITLKKDFFDGWNEHELENYIKTDTLPPRLMEENDDD